MRASPRGNVSPRRPFMRTAWRGRTPFPKHPPPESYITLFLAAAQPTLGGESGYGAVADRRGDLAVRLVVDVARAEHAGNIGRHVFARKDVALVIEGDRILEPFVVRGLAEEDENPVHGQRGAFAGLRVFEDGGGQLAVRNFHVHDLGRLEALHAGIAEQGVLRGLRREEAIHDFHHGQLGDAEIQEVQAFVEGAVPAADHEHALAFVRSAVADRAEVHLIAFGASSTK